MWEMISTTRRRIFSRSSRSAVVSDEVEFELGDPRRGRVELALETRRLIEGLCAIGAKRVDQVDELADFSSRRSIGCRSVVVAIVSFLTSAQGRPVIGGQRVTMVSTACCTSASVSVRS